MKIRLHKIRKALTFKFEMGEYLLSEGVKLEDKKIVSLILRGFTDEQIINLGNEIWMYWDNRRYWKAKKELGLSTLDFYVPYETHYLESLYDR